MYQIFKNTSFLFRFFIKTDQLKVSQNQALLAFLFVFAITLTAPQQAHAALDCTVPVDDSSQSPVSIVCVIPKAVNVLLLSSGAIFILIIIFCAFKMASSLGDPKGFMGGSQTCLWAIIGLFAVAFFQVILRVTVAAIGLDEGFVNLNIYESLQNALCNLFVNSSTRGPIITNIPGCTY